MHNYPRSAYEKTGGMAFFPRMLDKIRLHTRGELHVDYHPNLGLRADSWCLNFLRINYADLKARVLAGGTDEEILKWCFQHGRALNEGDINVWNGYMLKIGWRDAATPLRCKRPRQTMGLVTAMTF